MEHYFVKDVNPDYHNWCLKVRVVRFKEYLGDENPPVVRRLDFVLLDEKGDAMEGQIPQRLLDSYKGRLQEDSIYYIKSFEVAAARPNYKPVESPYLARFTKHTKITPVADELLGFPLYAYTLLTCEELTQKAGNIELLSDTIGVMERCTPVQIANTRHGRRPFRKVHLTNGSQNFTVTLWSNNAHGFDVDQCMEHAKSSPVVLLFCGVTSGTYMGQLALQAAPICRWYVDPNIPEAALLKNRCAASLVHQKWNAPQQQFGGKEKIATLALFDNPHEIVGNSYIVSAKVNRIPSQPRWWYNSCNKCRKKTNEYGDRYKCSDSGCDGTGAEPRYNLSFTGQDIEMPEDGDAPSIEFICFGPTAEELIGLPVQRLVELGGGTGFHTPTQITRLKGRTYELQVSVTRGSLHRDNISFKVDSILSMAVVPQVSTDPTTPGCSDTNLEGQNSESNLCITPQKGAYQETMETQTIAVSSNQLPIHTPPPVMEGDLDTKISKRAHEDKQKAIDTSDPRRTKKTNVARKLNTDPEAKDN